MRPFANAMLALDTVLTPQEAAKQATCDWLTDCAQQLAEAIELSEVGGPAAGLNACSQAGCMLAGLPNICSDASHAQPDHRL